MEVKVRTRQPYKIIALASVVLLLVVIGGLMLHQQQKNLSNPFSVHIRSQADADLYYPASLPDGFKIEANSISQPDKGVTIVSFKNSKQQSIHMSQQSIPKGFDMNHFLKNVQQPAKLQTAAGEATLGTIDDGKRVQHVASINGKGDKSTWILINANKDIPLDTLKKISERLVKSD